MSLKFGTDGVRGRAFVDLRPEWVTNLAISASDVLQSDIVVNLVGTVTVNQTWYEILLHMKKS